MENSVFLNKELYDELVICEAISVYEDLAQIQIKDRISHWECFFDRCRYSTAITIKEFENYLIGLSVQEGAKHVSM